tara:strand:- start:1549 stop:2457 length:909 start_codon:yes stop_codon:yes gene_type:complete
MITILSYGAGQDSHTILTELLTDPAYRAEHAPGELIVIMSNTGNEHPHTYRTVRQAAQFCADHGVTFHFLGDAYKTEAWQGGLVGQWERGIATVGSKSYPKTCTDKLKIQPIYKKLAELLEARGYGKAYRKQSLYGYAARHGKLRVLIGIACGEEKRAKGVAANPNKWLRENVELVYPLLSEGMDRAACQSYLKATEPVTGIPCPMPSNCMFCPFNQEFDLVWLHRNHPEELEKWIDLEANKIASDHQRPTHDPAKNFGVWGKTGVTLADNLADGIAKYGAMTDAELHEYKFSHGHCVASGY